MYRNRPVEAVKDFPIWLEKGYDMFVLSMDAVTMKYDGNVNKPRDFDASLLDIKEGDSIQTVACIETDLVVEEKTKQSWRNHLSWLERGSLTDMRMCLLPSTLKLMGRR